MASLVELSSLFTEIDLPGGSLDFSGLSDLVIFEEQGVTYLLTAAEATGRLHLFDISGAVTPNLLDTIEPSSNSGTDTVGHLNHFQAGGQGYVLASGRYEDHATLIENNPGLFGTPIEISGDAGIYANFTQTMSVNFDINDYVIAAKRNTGGFTIYDLESDLSMDLEAQVSDTGALALGDVSAMAHIHNGPSAYLYFGSALDDGIDIYSLGRKGALAHIDTIRPWETSGFDAIQDFQTLSVEGQNYLIAAGAGTSSLTVFEVHQSGNLFETNHLIDDLNTRFGGVRDIDHVSDGWRDFIVAGGGDDGITVFEFYANGTMSAVANLADDFGTALANVSSVQGAVINGNIEVFAGSDSEHGISRFEFTPDLFVNRFIANDVALPEGQLNVTIGSNKNDQIFGQQLSDFIKGGKGDDRLDGGLARDWYYGGPGADTFVFRPDAIADQIDDYEHGLDIIDLSAYPLVGEMEDISLESRRWGGIVHVNGEMIIVKTHDLARIETHEWSEADFIF